MGFLSQLLLARCYDQPYSFPFPVNCVCYFSEFLPGCIVLQPHFRRPLFDAPEFTWSVEWSTFGDTFHYFFYVLKKVSP